MAITAGRRRAGVARIFLFSETVLYEGRSYKIYRGMGTIDAMRAGSGVESLYVMAAGRREYHPHDVTITREAPNYNL